jgi:hypothetical protein
MTTTTAVDDREPILIRMPPKLKQAIVREVEARDVNMNHLITQALADYYLEPYDPYERPSRVPAENKLTVVVRVPYQLNERIRNDAFEKRSNKSDIVMRILVEAFNVDVDIPPPHRTAPIGGGHKVAT